MIESLIDLRQYLHANPELSGQEEKTAAWLTKQLETLQPDEVKTQIGGHGILVTFDSGQPGKNVLFRSEMDALPIEEVNEFPHQSIYSGVSHKCGHDGHAIILLGLARKLSEKRQANGKVHLLFQPAEETGEGAQKVVQDKKFNVQPDFVFALHNIPGYSAGNIIIKEGLFTAAVNSLIIRLQGKEAHAAEPETGNNPALAIGEIMTMALALNQPDVRKKDFQLVTPVFSQLGSKSYGTAAGAGEVHFTLRSWDNDTLQLLEKNILEGTEKIARKFELKWQHAFTQTFFANSNDSTAISFVKKAAQQLNLSITEREFPFKWGEDFGFLTSQYKGCMFGIGSGENHPALHNPDYDFPDEILILGVNMFYNIIQHVSS